MRAVLDPNVVISGALSSRGAPAGVLRAFEMGEFELVASEALMDELARALACPKLRRHISEPDAAELLRWVADGATVVVDPQTEPPVHSRDPDDDYLIALASAHSAALVSGDRPSRTRGGDSRVLPARLSGLAHRRLRQLLPGRWMS